MSASRRVAFPTNHGGAAMDWVSIGQRKLFSADGNDIELAGRRGHIGDAYGDHLGRDAVSIDQRLICLADRGKPDLRYRFVWLTFGVLNTGRQAQSSNGLVERRCH